jgi:hypothetical protein
MSRTQNFEIPRNSTSKTIYPYIFDTTSGAAQSGLTGLVYNTAGLICNYIAPGDPSTVITLATIADIEDDWTSGGFLEVNATVMPGLYRFDIPNALLASTDPGVMIRFQGAANMAQTNCYIATPTSNNILIVDIFPPFEFKNPVTGSTVFTVEVWVRDQTLTFVAPDSAPTVTVYDRLRTVVTGRLVAHATTPNPATGKYLFTYTAQSSHKDDDFQIEALAVKTGYVGGSGRWCSSVRRDTDSNVTSLLSKITTDSVSAKQSNPSTNSLEIVQDTDYDDTAFPKPEWEVDPDETDLTSFTSITFTAVERISRTTMITLTDPVNFTVVNPGTAGQKVTMNVLNTDFTTKTPGRYDFSIVAVLSGGEKYTVANGEFKLTRINT